MVISQTLKILFIIGYIFMGFITALAILVLEKLGEWTGDGINGPEFMVCVLWPVALAGTFLLILGVGGVNCMEYLSDHIADYIRERSKHEQTKSQDRHRG